MAYEFNGSNQYISASAPIAIAPFTIAARVWKNNTESTQIAVALNRVAAGNDHSVVYANNDNTTKLLDFQSPGGYGIATGSGTLTSGIWQHYCGTWASTSSRAIYRDGGNKGTNTGLCAPANINTLIVAAYYNGSAYSLFWGGKISEVGIWNISLSDADVMSLHKGFKCIRVRPQNLIYYSPLVRNLQDIRNGITLTNNNTATAAAHPRVY